MQKIRLSTPTVLALLACAYFLFLIFGSLVPLNFSLLPLSEAWQKFTQLSFQNLSIGSRSDLVANILLYIPLSYFIVGSLWYRHSRCEILTMISVVLFCQTLSIFVEFLQIFSPPRTTDLRDILANGLGSVLGVTLWCHYGQHINRNFLRWQRFLGMDKNKIAPIYLLLFTIYNLLPLDLTISPVEIYHKFTDDRVIYIPFYSVHEVWIGRKLQIFSLEASIWAVIGLFWMLSSSIPARYVFFNGVMYVAAIEILQLFVFSRVTDITDVLSGTLGIGVGVLAALYLRSLIPSMAEVSAKRLTVLVSFSISAVWSLIICLQFWFPFNFSFNSDFISLRWQQVNTFPFWLHFYSSEVNSLADIMKTLFIYSPLGIFVGFFTYTLGYGRFSKINYLVIIYFLLFATFIELGQILRPDSYPDITDVAFAWVSAIIGYFVSLQFHVSD